MSFLFEKDRISVEKIKRRKIKKREYIENKRYFLE